MAFAFVIGPDEKRVDIIKQTVKGVLEKEVKDTASVFPVISKVPVATHGGKAANLVFVAILHEKLLVGKEEKIVKAISALFEPYSVFVTVISTKPWGTGGQVL